MSDEEIEMLTMLNLIYMVGHHYYKSISPDGDTDYFDIVARVLQGDTVALSIIIIYVD